MEYRRIHKFLLLKPNFCLNKIFFGEYTSELALGPRQNLMNMSSLGVYEKGPKVVPSIFKWRGLL